MANVKNSKRYNDRMDKIFEEAMAKRFPKNVKNGKYQKEIYKGLWD